MNDVGSMTHDAHGLKPTSSAGYRVAALAGDGIGPEILEAAQAVADAAAGRCGVRIEWVPLPMGREALKSDGDPMPASTVDALRDCHGCLMGPHDSASYPKSWHALRTKPPAGVLRIGLDLHLNIRPARSIPGIGRDGLDVTIVRENTEGFYADRNMFIGVGEFMPSPDVALSVGVFTRAAIERAAVGACELAVRRRGRLAIVHKANVLPLTTGLFRDVCVEVASRYDGLDVSDYHADALCALLVRDPARFDVIVAENMFGDILSDLTAELAGGLGLGPSLNVGREHAMAQPVHGAAPDIQGRGIANPTGMILSGAMLFDWLAERHGDERLRRLAETIRASVHEALLHGERTRDLGGSLDTRQFTEAVVSRASA